MSKLNREIASKEFNAWLDAKKVGKNKRTADYEAIESTIVDAIEEGLLIINDDKSLTYQLNFPLDKSENKPITSLKIKMRLTVGEMNVAMSNSKSNEDKILGILSALTNENKGTIRALDTVDYNVLQSIATYFL